LGRSQGGFSTKIHLICDGNGLPIAVEIGPGQEHETQHLTSLVDAVAVAQRGRPAKRRPAKLVGDKGYSAGWIRRWLRQHRITPVIAHRCNEAGANDPFDREAYRQRNLIERLIGWLKERRRLATRYEKLALHYLGMLHLGMILRFLDS
jgi:transposase